LARLVISRRLARPISLLRLIYDLGNRQWDIPQLCRLPENILPASTHFDNYRVEHMFPKIGRRAMLVQGRRLEQGDGRAPSILLWFQDVTEQERVEEQFKKLTAMLEQRIAERTEKLTDTNQLLQAIMDAALIGIITLDERGVIESFNPAALQIFGCAPKEFLGQNVSRFLASPDQPRNADFMCHLLEVEKQWWVGDRNEVVGRRKDGVRIILDLSLAEITHGGRRRLVAMLRDITKRKRLERELLEISERERLCIGQDLHDGLGQQLHGLSYPATLLEKGLRDPRVTSPAALAASYLQAQGHEVLHVDGVCQQCESIALAQGVLH
jgi:PAS domain S-box-containing protein